LPLVVSPPQAAEGENVSLEVFRAPRNPANPEFNFAYEILRLKDYSESGVEPSPGLTWEIYSSPRKRPYTTQKALQEKSWAGKNTRCFYEHLISDSQLWCKPTVPKNFEQYPIKLMGRRIQPETGRLGVLKVEFPTTFDSQHHYKIEDKEFFERCCEALAPEMETLAKFLDCSWFSEKTGSEDFHEFQSLIFAVTHSKLLADIEHPEFWKSVKAYAKKLASKTSPMSNHLSSQLNALGRQFGTAVISELTKQIGGEVARNIFPGMWTR